jgi:hypothetical protein
MLNNVAVSFGRARSDHIAQTGERAHRMFRIVVVPRNAVIVEECEQLVLVFVDSLLQSRTSLSLALQGSNTL